MREEIRREICPYTGSEIILYDIGQRDSMGKHMLGYELYDSNAELIFQGNDFSASPLHAIDSNMTLGGIIGFLALKEGDVESEYFDNYTPKQLEFAEQHGEQLYLFAMELEERK